VLLLLVVPLVPEFSVVLGNGDELDVGGGDSNDVAVDDDVDVDDDRDGDDDDAEEGGREMAGWRRDWMRRGMMVESSARRTGRGT